MDAVVMEAAVRTRPSRRPAAWLDGALLAGRQGLIMRRRPASVASAVVFPMVFTLLFFTVFGRVMERIGIDYAQYLLPAVVLQAMFFTGMSAAILAAEDASGGMLARLRTLPVSRAAPFVGLVVAEVARALISLVVLVPLGLLLGFRFHAGPFAAIGFVAITLTFAATACAGYIALGLRVSSPDAAQAMVMLPYFPLLLVSNAFAPVDRFPGWLQPVVRNQPVSQVCDALRALADGGRTARPVVEALAWLVVLFGVFTVAAARGFGRPR